MVLPLTKIEIYLYYKYNNYNFKQINMLNNDVLMNIFRYIEIKDKSNISSVSKQFNEIYNNNILWSYYILQYERNIIEELYTINDMKTTKLIYSMYKLNKSCKYNNIISLLKTSSLSIQYSQLKQIPSEIKNLINLQSLSFSYNQITYIPSEIGNLTNLQYFSLDNNQITHIPSEIGNLTNLQYLYLNNNQIKHIPSEISNLTNLQYLYLNNNQIIQLPSEIGNLTNLQYLNLNNNQIIQLPSEICKPSEIK